MFELKSHSFGPISQYTLKDKENGAYVSVLPGYGGLINGLGLFIGGEIQELIRPNYDYQELFDRGRAIFRNMKLSPFPNRVNNGKYSFNGDEYQLEINEKDKNNALHGFVFNKKFEVVDHLFENEQGYFSIEYDYDGHLGGYPFPFTLKMDFYLNKKTGFSCKTSFTNNSGTRIPVGDGWHPYFATGTPIEDLELKIPPGKKLERDDNMIPNGDYKEVEDFKTPQRVGDKYLDDGFALNANLSFEVTQILDKHKNIEIQIWQETGKQKYNYLQIFTPPERDSIAIEPMTCAPDAFNNKMGLITMDPNETIEMSFGVRAGTL